MGLAQVCLLLCENYLEVAIEPELILFEKIYLKKKIFFGSTKAKYKLLKVRDSLMSSQIILEHPFPPTFEFLNSYSA